MTRSHPHRSTSHRRNKTWLTIECGKLRRSALDTTGIASPARSIAPVNWGTCEAKTPEHFPRSWTAAKKHTATFASPSPSGKQSATTRQADPASQHSHKNPATAALSSMCWNRGIASPDERSCLAHAEAADRDSFTAGPPFLAKPVGTRRYRPDV
ncbi:MAG TPA: hypothetical protein VIW24_24970 [Aldersonia sp.]